MTSETEFARRSWPDSPTPDVCFASTGSTSAVRRAPRTGDRSNRPHLGWLRTAASWGDASAEGARRQESVGSIFATPLVVGGTVYIGSADANLYAIE